MQPPRPFVETTKPALRGSLCDDDPYVDKLPIFIGVLAALVVAVALGVCVQSYNSRVQATREARDKTR